MGKTNKKKKLHLGVKPIGGPSMKSRRVARRVTSMYHNIRQSTALIEKDASLSQEEKQDQIVNLQEKLKEMGGIEKYQEASFISTQHFQTSKWIMQQLRRLNRINSSNQKLKTLEIGAINAQLYNSSYLDVRAIDINSSLPCIEECDFFDVPPKREYEVVVCSMVLNCVFDPVKRGDMLGRLLMQLTDTGLLFFILPKRCLSSVNIDGEEHFLVLLKAFGFQLVDPPHHTPRLIFLILSRDPALYTPKLLQQQSAGWETPIRKVLKRTLPTVSSESMKRFLQPDLIRDSNEFGVTIPTVFLSTTSVA